MGDRANIYLRSITKWNADSKKRTYGGMYLYTHRNGSEWPEYLRQALDFGKDRWLDDQYLARIIVSRVFMDSHDTTLGAGLSLTIGDNEYDITCVDLEGRYVGWAKDGDESNPAKWYGKMSFDDFVALPQAFYPNADGKMPTPPVVRSMPKSLKKSK